MNGNSINQYKQANKTSAILLNIFHIYIVERLLLPARGERIINNISTVMRGVADDKN